MTRRNTIENFHDNYEPITETGCWIWIGNSWRSKQGERGRFNLNGRQLSAPRLSYTIFKGEIPDGLQINHRCNVPICVNPDHLYAGSHQDNMDDMVRHGRAADKRGEKNGRTKLNELQVIEILESSESNRSISKKYAVNPSTIDLIKRGKSWGHISQLTNRSAI